MEQKTYVGVIGHQNPDTDSICSAIAYANLKNLTDESHRYGALRAGAINRETEYVLKRFGQTPPALCQSVRAQVMDIDIRRMPGVDGELTVRRAWEIMRDSQISTLPIVDGEGYLQGIISLKDLAMANMDSQGTRFLADSNTSYQNIMDTLQGTMITGDPEDTVTKGKIVIGAASPEIMEDVVEEGDIVLVANRYEAQYCAIEAGAHCIIVCTGSAVPKTIIRLAVERGCNVISTPYDTYPAAMMISQAVPIRFYMKKNIMTFKTTDSIENVKEIMGKVRHVYFPVLDQEGKYVGVISRRNLLNLRRKRLILVDHNEKTQCVEGWEEADILEIIDHHRIGNLETSGPVYFRNQPVGCTATVIYQMYREKNVEISQEIAGLLLSAILSDTLNFQSPTSTFVDEMAGEALAAIAGVEIDELAQALFEAGENLEGKTTEEVLLQDYKPYDQDGIRFGVGQGSFVSHQNYERAKEMMLSYLPEAPRHLGVGMVFYMLTDLVKNVTLVLCAGDGAEELICKSFGVEKTAEGILLPNVVSRKKQFIPRIFRTLQEQ